MKLWHRPDPTALQAQFLYELATCPSFPEDHVEGVDLCHCPNTEANDGLSGFRRINAQSSADLKRHGLSEVVDIMIRSCVRNVARLYGRADR